MGTIKQQIHSVKYCQSKYAVGKHTDQFSIIVNRSINFEHNQVQISMVWLQEVDSKVGEVIYV